MKNINWKVKLGYDIITSFFLDYFTRINQFQYCKQTKNNLKSNDWLEQTNPARFLSNL